ncbi:cell division protein ZapA [Rhizobium sp. LjRoot30]|uniref:cell division protein ZapA n=1 Tax=Rhizobium sp. LjRoot30 TaxID=3342320 RepID=UPI003ECDAF78
MAQVTVMIDGKAYRMACEEGQEGHLTDLADRFDRYVGHLKSQFGEIGDLRLTVMAGIMVMDELSDVSRRLARLEAEMKNLSISREDDRASSVRTEELLAATIEEVTARIQGLTAKLTGRPGTELN